MITYEYWGYGLTIRSEIQFPELLVYPFSGEADLNIIIGTTPEILAGDNVVNRVGVSITPNAYLLKIAGIAGYYAENGNTVIVQPAPGADDRSIRLFLLSNAMAAILHQRNIIPLHASAIKYQDGIALICGDSDAGKSTTLSMLQQHGYQIFSDEVCVLQPAAKIANSVKAYASYPALKLWEDSFAMLNLEKGGEEARIRPRILKYNRFYHEAFDTRALPVKVVFVLETNNHAATPQALKLGTIPAFRALEQNTYKYEQVTAMQKRDVLFGAISRLTASVSIYQISRPKAQNTLTDVAELIKTYL